MKKDLFVLYKDTQNNICLTSSNEKASKEVASYIAGKTIESPCYGVYFNGYTQRQEVIFVNNPYEGYMDFVEAKKIIEDDDNFNVIKQGYVNRNIYMNDFITFEA